MKKLGLLVGLFLLICCLGDAIAQNKTLGVGVTTPNPNAVLHVESPTGNQGFILPRLSTAQRTATSFTSVLKDSDKGLLVYDTNLNTIYIWNGIMWKSTAQVAGGPKLLLPYADTIMAPATDNTSLLNIIYAASASQNVSVAKFQNMNGANTGAALYVSTNGIVGAPATASAAILGETSTAFSAITGRATGGVSNGVAGVSASADPGSYAVLGSNSGGGPAGVFTINNATNATTAMQVSTSGVGGAGKFTVSNVNNPTPALWAETNSNQPLSAPIYGRNTGTGDVAGSFRIENAANASSALFAETNGTGPAVFGNQLGTGRGGQFQIQNAANTEVAVRAFTNGTGRAGFFSISNTANTSPVIFASTNGSGAAINGENAGAANGFAGLFNVTNPTNTFPAIQASSAGSGSGVRVMQGVGSVGPGMDVFIQNTTGTAPGLSVDQQGLGSGSNISINNGASTASALFASTIGRGDVGFFQINTALSTNAAVKGRVINTGGGAGAFEIFNSSNLRDALFSITQGTGSAGNFNVDNTTSTNSAIIATTNGIGTTILANHTGASGDIAVFQNNGFNVARIAKNGQGLFNGGTVASGADVAEMFGIEGLRNSYEPGDVLVISEDTDRTVQKSETANSTKVAGVYATKPGVTLTERNLNENLDDLVPMGVIGVIPTKVCLENGPIKRGDLLVTSSKPGHAMKAVPAILNGIVIYPTGAILGKALENFDSQESGLIKVLVNVK